MTNLFWTTNPLILIDKNHFTEIFPTPEMQYVSKLNAVTRLTILLTCVGHLVQPSSNILRIGVGTMIMILLIQLYYNKTGKTILGTSGKKGTSGKTSAAGPVEPTHVEGFVTRQPTPKIDSPPVIAKQQLAKSFSPTTSTNPMSNVLLTDIHDNPNKKSAPPSFMPEVHDNINKAARDMVRNENKDQPNIDKTLFGSLGENFDFDSSMRQFTPTANTRVVNDQGAFAQFLYGNMPSCKDGDVLQCS